MMFCENCGNEMEKAKFCPICGAEQTAVVTPSASVPAGSAPVTAPSAPAPSVPTAPTAPSVPTGAPNVPINPIIYPTINPIGVPSSQTVVIAEGKKRAPEKKYTAGHLALCLITAAIMAGIAGVFAGLYFTLLWSIQ